MLVPEGLVGLHRTIQLQHFSITGQGIDLDYCDIEWFALETNRDHSVIFEIASKYCILDSLVDHDGYCRGPAPVDPGNSKRGRHRGGSGNSCLIKC